MPECKITRLESLVDESLGKCVGFDAATMHCAKCGCSFLHPCEVGVMQGKKFLNVKPSGESCCYQHDTRLRGSAIVSEFWCEECNEVTTALVIAFHKGCTIMDLVAIDGGTITGELWRD